MPKAGSGRRVGLAGALSLAVGFGISFVTEPARAACDPAAANNVTATCSGDTTNQGGGAPGTSASTFGYGTGVENNVTVNVLAGATVVGTNVGIRLGTNATINNSGAITSTTSDAISGSFTNLINNGSITGADDGIIGGTLTNLINNGTITAGFTNALAFTTITNLVNTGTITANNTGIAGGTLTSLTNSGTITGNGGISVGTLTSLTNTGSISGDFEAIRATTITSLTNAGLISGGTSAIRETGAANTTLTLLPGSVIIGAINLGGGVNTLNVGNGLSIANTFASAPVIGMTYGAPFAVSGNQVAVVDPTNLAVVDEAHIDLTNGISSTVLNRLNRLRNGVAGVTTSQPMAVGTKDGGDVADHTRQYWVQGFGAKRDQEGDGPAVDANIETAGFVSGMDAQYSAQTRTGFFLGGSWGDVSAAFGSQDTEIDSFFGGAYVSTLRGRTAIDMTLTLGYSDYDRERQVANNLVAGGLQTATADYDGWFISPEITFTRPFWPMGMRLEKSVTLRYAGLFLDGFTETGAAAPLTVNTRDIHVAQARAQLAAPLTHSSNDGATSRLMVKGGIEGRTQFGDENVSGALLAQSIVFDPGGDDSTVGAFAGLEAEHVTANGFTFHASLEGLIEDDGSTQVSGKAGIRFRF